MDPGVSESSRTAPRLVERPGCSPLERRSTSISFVPRLRLHHRADVNLCTTNARRQNCPVSARQNHTHPQKTPYEIQPRFSMRVAREART